MESDGFESNNSDSVLERDARGLVETVMDLSLRQRLRLYAECSGGGCYAGKRSFVCARERLYTVGRCDVLSLSSVY